MRWNEHWLVKLVIVFSFVGTRRGLVGAKSMLERRHVLMAFADRSERGIDKLAQWAILEPQGKISFISRDSAPTPQQDEDDAI